MSDKIKQILQELYQIDASLQKHEVMLIKVIEQLLALKPDLVIDQRFLQLLRTELMNRSQNLNSQPSKKIGFWLWLSQVNKVTALSVLVILFVLLSLPVYFLFNKNQPSRQLAIKSEIELQPDRAFGNLVDNNLPVDPKTISSSYMPQADNARSESATAQPAPKIAMGVGGGGGVSTNAVEPSMVPPYYGGVNYNVIYTGQDFATPTEKMLVYKKIDNQTASQSLARLINQSGLFALDLSQFSNTQVEYLSLKEDRQFGYMINLDLINNTFNIFKNWEKWPRPDADCRDEACYEAFRLKPADVPADDQIISLADQFIRQYHVDISSYGQGQVLAYWRNDFVMAGQPEQIYVPEDTTVVYPLMIENQTVADENGDPAGLYVDIDIRNKKGSSIREISVLNFVSSYYEAETDPEKLMTFLKQGGLRRFYRYDQAQDTVDIEVGTPQLSLVRIWHYEPITQRSSQIYVPAYLFPVEKISNPTYFYGKNIIVPIIKDFIQAPDTGVVEPRPMPLNLPAAEVKNEPAQK